MIERIEQLRSQAEQGDRRRHSSEELEEVRVRVLGRKAELPQILRGSPTWSPSSAAPSAAPPTRRARRWRRRSPPVHRSWPAPSSRRGLRGDAVDVTLPGAPPQPIGHLHVLTSTRRELEDIFLGLGFTVKGGAGGGSVHYNFDALNHSPTHPARARTDTFYVQGEGPQELVLRTHTSPMQVRAMEAHPPPLYVVIPGARIPPGLRRHPHAPVPPDRGPGGR